MTNILAVCLLAVIFCGANLAFARQLPKECTQGPSYWCKNLRSASDCGAVGHCTSTVWSQEYQKIRPNAVSAKFLKLFNELKDVKDLINEKYLGSRLHSACMDVPYPNIASICKSNTYGIENYVNHVLWSKATPETMCGIIGMCNNEKLDHVLELNKKQKAPAEKKELLGSAHCTWGPSYWCSNLTTSHECKAAHHCVTRVWPHVTFAEDNDSICKICTDMVAEARDQLQSNETQDELRQVFEGSCKLIPIKIVRKECIKLADDFVPELVETLSSEMNPQAVCSVAGLCNNAKIDEMLIEYNARLELRSGCNNCSTAVAGIRKKFDATSYEDFLTGLLQVCRKADSLSDSCSMLVFKYYEDILAALKKDLTPQSVCHVSGQCAYKYHTHDEFEFPEPTSGPVTDDVPCEFCEQLVKHMRNTFVANTTELEFYKVLKGLCKQTGQFKSECLSLAEQYYPVIYKFLTSELKPDVICKEIGICGEKADEPIAVLLPEELQAKAKVENKQLIGDQTKPKLHRVTLDQQTNVRVVPESTSKPYTGDAAGVLPIERMFVSVPQDASASKTACSFCEYFLHYLQVELSDSTNIAKISEAIDKACDRLPKSVNAECRQFVDQYGPAVLALLVQEIDPASVCPALNLCPKVKEVEKVDINAKKSSCPLCLFAVEQLKAMLKNDHSEQNIRKALDDLCTHLSAKLRTNCVDFVDTYTQQLIEMLAADLDPQEICVYIKLCPDDVNHTFGIYDSDKYHDKPQLRGDRNNFRGKTLLPRQMFEFGGDIETNEIPDATVNGRSVTRYQTARATCALCQLVMSEIDKQVADKHNRDEIIKTFHNICKHVPKDLRSECDTFVEKYGELVVSLLAQELAPTKVCDELKLCTPTTPGHMKAIRNDVLDCAVCETVAMAVKKVLSDDTVDRNIVHVIEKSCSLLPAKYSARCLTMMEIYGTSVIQLIEQFGVKGVCQKIGLCSNNDAAYVRMYREKRN